MKTLFGTLAALALLSPVSHAFAQAKEQNVVQTISIDARPEVVWAIAGDFVNLPRWYPFIESSRVVLGKNNVVGCVRELTRMNGTKVEEKLIDYNPWDRSLSYTYAEGQTLFSDYFATVTVMDTGNGGSTVEWKAKLKRLDYTVDDPAGDEKIVQMLNGGYRKGLETLKRLAEEK